MGTGTGTGSQSLLAGVDDTLDNFFKSAGPKSTRHASSSKAKRKRDTTTTSNPKSGTRVSVASPLKKSRLSGAKDVTTRYEEIRGSHVYKGDVGVSPSMTTSKKGVKGKERRVLDDVTTVLQNSPHRRATTNTRGLSGPAFRRPRFTSPSARAKAVKKGKEGNSKVAHEIEGDSDSGFGSGIEENDVALRLRAKDFGKAKTPHRAFKDRLRGFAPLPTPPSSSMPSSRTLIMGIDMHTPFTFSSANLKAKEGYPTPASLAVPRLKLGPRDAEGLTARIPAPDLLHRDDDDDESSLALLSSSPPACSQVGRQVEKDEDEDERCEIITKVDLTPEKVSPRKDKEKDKMFTVIPSSQTQYIHYSPTKKRTYDFLGLNARAQDRSQQQPSTVVIPCSQTTQSSSSSSSSSQQVVYLSPRVTRKPAPLVMPTSSSLKKAELNLVVPTSQEDEEEISILDGPIALMDSSRTLNADVHNEGDQHARTESLADDNSKSNSQQRNERSDLPEEALSTISKPEEKSTINTPSQSTQFRFINAMLDDLDRLTEEARLGIVTPSQVLSRAKVARSSSSSRRGEKQSQSQAPSGELLMQSSVTEPDTSQWDEDPFTLTNEAYARHLGVGVGESPRMAPHGSQAEGNPPFNENGLKGGLKMPVTPTSLRYSSCTQSSSTQPDSDEEEDPFPTLPPASSAVSTSSTAPPPTSTAESSTDRNAVDRMLDSSQTLPDSQEDLGSFPLLEDESISTLDVVRALDSSPVGYVESTGQSTVRFRRESENSATRTPTVSSRRHDNKEDSSQTLPDSQDELENLPFPVSETNVTPQSQSQVESVSTLDVMKFLDSDEASFGTPDRISVSRAVMKFRRRNAEHHDDTEEGDDEEEDDGEGTLPSAVRDFLAIFSQSESPN